jgi:hypothetical protein
MPFRTPAGSKPQQLIGLALTDGAVGISARCGSRGQPDAHLRKIDATLTVKCRLRVSRVSYGPPWCKDC